RPSMDGSNTSAAPPSASETSPTTSPDRCSKPEDSDHSYTLDCDEPYSSVGEQPGAARRVEAGRGEGLHGAQAAVVDLAAEVAGERRGLVHEFVEHVDGHQEHREVGDRRDGRGDALPCDGGESDAVVAVELGDR